MLEWNAVKIDNLISVVKEFPALYDNTYEDYSCKEKKDELWKIIGKKLGTTARNCRRKWIGMCMAYHKLKETGTVIKDGKEWPWFKHLRFTEPDIQKNGCDGNAEASTGISSNITVQYKNDTALKTDTNRERDKREADINAITAMSTSLVTSLSFPSVDLSSRECSTVNGTKSSVASSDSQTNLNANKLFLESIVNDMSSLTLKEQYDFKVEVLVLLKGFLLGHHI